jgi:signal transduction histidine kinase
VEYKGRDEVGEFARSFNDMAAKLERTETVRRELLATVSHELRTPLTSIQGYMEGLIDGVVPQEPETYHLVRREAERLTRLVGDIERLSRLEAGAEPVEPESLATAPVVTEAVDCSTRKASSWTCSCPSRFLPCGRTKTSSRRCWSTFS